MAHASDTRTPWWVFIYTTLDTGVQQQIHSAAGTSGSSARRTWRRDGHAQRAALAELRAGGLALSIFLTQWIRLRSPYIPPVNTVPHGGHIGKIAELIKVCATADWPDVRHWSFQSLTTIHARQKALIPKRSRNGCPTVETSISSSKAGKDQTGAPWHIHNLP